MDDTMFVIVVSALTGAVVTAVAAIIQNILSLRAKFDESLRESRLAAYKPLWKKTKLLPMWPRADNVTYAAIQKLSEDFREWYFDVGGIYLSAQSRKTFENVQKKLCEVVESDQAREDENASITGTEYDIVQSKCSALRTELTRDLQSRKRALLAKS